MGIWNDSQTLIQGLFKSIYNAILENIIGNEWIIDYFSNRSDKDVYTLSFQIYS